MKNVPETKTNVSSSEMPTLDTPPATPDSTPMSIGNSPNFKHQPNITAIKEQQPQVVQTITQPTQSVSRGKGFVF